MTHADDRPTASTALNLDGEEWRPVPGIDGYDVSNLGRVRSGRRLGEKKILRGSLSSKGYPTVQLWPNGKWMRARVHRLVLLAFVGPCPDWHEAAHLNGVPGDNRVVNLRWVLPAENSGHKRIHGTQPRGDALWNAKLTDSSVIEMRDLHSRGWGHRRLSRKFGTSESTARDVIRGTTWKHLLPAMEEAV